MMLSVDTVGYVLSFEKQNRPSRCMESEILLTT